MEIAANTDTGLVNTVKEAMNPEYFMKKFGLTSDKLVNIGLYLAVGFFAGFLMKKYLHGLFVLAFGVAGLALLHYGGYVTVAIHWDKLQALGLGSVPTFDTAFFTLAWEWAKMNVAVSVSLVAGFFIGLKVG